MIIKDFIKMMGAMKVVEPEPTPTGEGYLIAGFPGVEGADYTSYNGLYEDTGNTVNGKPIYQNAAGHYLYRYYFYHNQGDEEDPWIVSRRRVGRPQ